MNKEVAFDALAAGYDAVFSASLVGREQRRQSRHCLQKFLAGKTNLTVLEINCGTGDDALWLAEQGHTVIATDQSAAMINLAQQKQMADQNNRVQFRVCSFNDLGHSFPDQQFDLIFSNFAGLNCISPGNFQSVSTKLCSLLNNNGHLAMVVFGKYSIWETLYFLCKGKTGDAFRRWSNREVKVQLAAGVLQPVYYYSVSRLSQMLQPLKLVDKRPVGLFIPPSYLEQMMQKRPQLYRSLLKAEERTRSFSGFSALADHTYVLFKKENA